MAEPQHQYVSDLLYGDVTMHNVQTEVFDQTAIYDPSGTDLIAWKYTLGVVGWIYPDPGNTYPLHGVYGYGINRGIANSSMSNQANQILDHLLTPRRNLVFNVGGANLLTATPVAGVQQFDANLQNQLQQQLGTAPPDPLAEINNGPHPISARLTKIVGSGIFRVRFEVEATLNPCTKLPTILSNRWSLIESLDLNNYITRTIQGRIRFSSVDMKTTTEFMSLIVPGLSSGFRRMSISTTCAPNGLDLDYTVVDQRISNSAPPPATEWNCIHKELSQMDGSDNKAGLSNVAIQMYLKGAPDVDKSALLTTAFKIIEAKLGWKSQDTPKGKRALAIIQLDLTDYMHDSAIEVSCVAQRQVNYLAEVAGTQNATQIEAVNGFYETFGIALDKGIIDNYDPLLSATPVNYPPGSSAHSFVVFLQSPCTSHQIPMGIGVSGSRGAPPPAQTKQKDTPPNYDSANPGSANEATSVSTATGNLPNSPLKPDMFDTTSENDGVYTTYKIDIGYQTDYFQVHMPVSLDQSSSAGGDQATSVLGSLAPPISKRYAIVEGQRRGSRPSFPAHVKFTDGSLGDCTPWGRATVKQLTPAPTQEGVFTYSAQAEYWWACEKAYIADSTGNYPKVRGSCLPWDKGKADDDDHSVTFTSPSRAML